MLEKINSRQVHYIRPLNVGRKGPQQCGRNRVAEPPVTISYAKTIDLLIAIVRNVEDVAYSVTISAQDSHVAAECG